MGPFEAVRTHVGPGALAPPAVFFPLARPRALCRVLNGGPAPRAIDQQVVDLLDDWASRDAPRMDADDDSVSDEAGPAIMDEVWRPLAEVLMRPRFGDLVGDLSLGGDGPS